MDSSDFDDLLIVQGEIPSKKPQLQVIIPSAAFGGAIISFILCPTELVKVCRQFSILN